MLAALISIYVFHSQFKFYIDYHRKILIYLISSSIDFLFFRIKKLVYKAHYYIEKHSMLVLN